MKSSHRLLDRLTIYLPVILMGLLAMGSYWLLRATPLSAPALPDQAPTHDADYFMRNFNVQNFEAAGSLKSELLGKEIKHYPDNDTLEIDQVHLRSFSKQGHLTTITAQRALSNGDGSEVQFFGDAHVVRDAYTDPGGKLVPRIELRSEFLYAVMDTEHISTPKAVELIRGNDRFTADAMDYDNLQRILQLHGHVVGRMMPDKH